MLKPARASNLQRREAKLVNEVNRLRQNIHIWRMTEEGPYAERKLKQLENELAAVRRQLQG